MDSQRASIKQLRAQEVEYALNFETKSADPAPKEINAIGKPHPMENPKLAIQLQQALDDSVWRPLKQDYNPIVPTKVAVIEILHETAVATTMGSTHNNGP